MGLHQKLHTIYNIMKYIPSIEFPISDRNIEPNPFNTSLTSSTTNTVDHNHPVQVEEDLAESQVEVQVAHGKVKVLVSQDHLEA